MHRSITTALLLSNLVLLGCLLFNQATEQAVADGTTSNRSHLALTARDRSGNELLFLVDTTNKKLSAYQMQSDGLALMAVRDLKYDAKLSVYRDGSAKEVTVKELKEQAKKKDRDR